MGLFRWFGRRLAGQVQVKLDISEEVCALCGAQAITLVRDIDCFYDGGDEPVEVRVRNSHFLCNEHRNIEPAVYNWLRFHFIDDEDQDEDADPQE